MNLDHLLAAGQLEKINTDKPVIFMDAEALRTSASTRVSRSLY
jgi:hypothetical protein